VREHGGEVKAYEVPLHGTARTVDHQASFGFASRPRRARSISHCNSVVERGFDAIEPVSEGDHGSPHRQASPSVTESGVSATKAHRGPRRVDPTQCVGCPGCL
jgi:hypothetical protein